jgi:hypothetical protein
MCLVTCLKGFLENMLIGVGHFVRVGRRCQSTGTSTKMTKLEVQLLGGTHCASLSPFQGEFNRNLEYVECFNMHEE